jgi:hypothetical protein
MTDSGLLAGMSVLPFSVEPLGFCQSPTDQLDLELIIPVLVDHRCVRPAVMTILDAAHPYLTMRGSNLAVPVTL